MAEVFDRRAALEEAFDSAEADAKGEEYVPPVRDEQEPIGGPEPSNIVPLETEKDPATVESEAAAKPPTKDKTRTKGVPPELRGKETPKPTGEEKPEGQPKVPGTDKAPLSWGPSRDVLWAKVPPDVRAAISKREIDIQQGMSQAGRLRQVVEEYHGLITPYEATIKSIGTTPKEAIHSVMQTATMMINGTQEQKCAILAEMIQRYGVDLQQFDTHLSSVLQKGGPVTRIQPTPPLDPRLAPLFSMAERLERAEQEKDQKQQQEAGLAIESIQNEPFFEDVRYDIADIMEISAKRGKIMTIKQAYDKAVQINPEVSNIVSQQKKKVDVSAAASTLARARRAASTVTGAPGSSVLGGGKADRRSALEAAWDSQA